MNKRRPALDGFVPRKPTDQIGQHHSETHGVPSKTSPVRAVHSGDESLSTLSERPTETTLGQMDIRESLRQVDDEPDQKKTRKRLFGRNKKRGIDGHPRKKKRILRWAIVSIVIAILAVVGYVGFKAFMASGRVFSGNILGVVQKQPLQEDENGRSNFLIFGTANDEGHEGADLTDSIMVLSINQTTNDAFMVSLPRDLWVTYEGICSVGYEGKLNAVYYCASNGQDEAAGATALQKKAGEILGLDIHYFAHINWAALVSTVDAVGGIDVTIESSDPRGILDRNFDHACNYQCYYVNYQNGETVHLDGEHALALARARNASGGYGLPGGNFDREKNQQKIIKALREKAVSAGTLTNLGKVTGLIDALGNNLRSNIQTNEIQTLMSLANDIQTENIRSLSLVEEDNMLVTTGQYSGQSIVLPVAGLRNFSGIQVYIASHASSNPIVREAAPIVVLNGTGEVGVAQNEADTLAAQGLTISAVDNAPEGSYAAVEIYQIGTGNTATAAKLQEIYGVSELKTTTPPVAVGTDTAFVVVIGAVRSAQ